MRKMARRRWFLLAALLLWGVALHPRAASAQTCGPAGPYHSYTGTVTLHNGPGCAGAAFIPLTISGPDYLQWQSYFGFQPPENSGCPNGHLDFYWAASGGWPGHYNFSASFPGYRSSDPTSGAVCREDHGLLCGCEGSTSIVLYPIDEPPEIRTPEAPASGPGSPGPCPPEGPCPGVGKPVNVLTGNVWLDQTDAQIPGLGAGLSLVRAYNSRLAERNVLGAFGRGWTHSYESKLSFLPGSVIKLRQPNGSPLFFEDPSATQTYAAMLPKSETSWIVKSGSTYTRLFRMGGSEAYDSNGLLTTLTDASGNGTTLTRDSSGNLASVSGSGGRTISFSYDSSGRVTSLAGPSGVIASYAYSSGTLQSATYGDGSGYTFGYDTSGRLLSVVDLSGRVVELHTYDGSGNGITSEVSGGQEKYTLAYATRSTLVTDALGNVTTYRWTSLEGATRRITEIEGGCSGCGGGGPNEQWTYDDNGRVLTHTDALGKITSYTYNSSGDRLTETDPLNHTTTYTYDTQGRVLTRTAPDGGVTTTTYGPAGPLTVTEKVTTSQNRTTTLTYNAQGKLATTTDPRGKVTTLGYSTAGDLTSVTDPLTHATAFGYDALGRRTTVTDSLNHTTTTAYDARGRVTRVTNHDGTHTDFAYDLGGRRTSVTDPLGRATSYGYDDYGRLETVADPIGGTTRHTYDAMSRLTALTDAKGNTTSFEYDPYGKVNRMVYPGGASETFVYYDGGRLRTKVDRKGVTTTYSYDAAGRLTGKTYSDGTPAVSYTYDLVGRLLAVANGTDTLTWTYDLAGQLLTEQSTKNASTVAYTYDTGGNRATINLNGTLFLTYAYDDASRLTTITRGSSAFGLGYDNANRRTSMTYPNGIATSYTYDNLNRLTRLKADLGATPVTDFQYVYDNAGNRTRKQQLDYTEDYAYDPLYRLTGVTRSAGSTSLWQGGYDPVGNRTSAQIGTSVSTSTYNEKNQLTSSTGGGPLRWRGTLNEPGSVAFTSALVNGKPAKMLQGNVFEATLDMTSGSNTVTVQATDVSGNVTTKNYQVSVTGSGATYTYDPNGNLTSKTEGSDAWAYTWNAENQLVKVEKNGAEVARFSYDPLGRRAEKVAAGVTTSYTYAGPSILHEVRGTTSLKYVQGFGIDEPLAADDGAALSYFHADGLGSIAKITGAAGAITLTRQYDTWGDLEVGASEPGFAFTGREWDPEIALYYYRARYYDPKVGRFLSEDPIGFLGSNNFYTYVENTPVNRIDPRGLASSSSGCCNQDWLTCMANCLAKYDPLGPAGDTILTWAGGTFWKSWIGQPTLLGSSPLTTVPSAAGGAAVRRVGRFFSPIWITYGNYLFFMEVHCAAACASWACSY